MKRNFFVALIVLLFFPALSCLAHTINYDFSTMSNSEVGLTYLQMGFNHILPLGLDHVLFILGLFFLNPKLKTVIWQATAFTVAHCITLGLAIYGVIHPLSSIIEPIIALSILFLAIENIFYNELKWWRVLIVFGFGLIHGCGFASALTDVGLPENNYLLALGTFNMGVELGQITVILSAWLLVGKWFANKTWYRKRIVIPVSVCIGFVALFWTIERTFFSVQ
jgi:hydrogenase/urease accessory protein HupE